MTTKRPAKIFNITEKNISPKRDINKPIYSISNRNIYKRGYTLVNKGKKINNIPKPLETSPNTRSQKIHENMRRRKNYSKKLLDEIRPQNVTSNKEYSYNYLLGINRTEINLNLDENLKRELNNNEKSKKNNTYINNRENMINMLKKENNKKSINNKESNDIKYAYNKIPLREKKLIKRKKELEREMTEPELLLSKKIKEKEKMNLSLNEKGKTDRIKNLKNNKEKTNKKESQNNPLICNNYVTINNTLVSNYPVKFIDVFHQ